MKTSFMLIEEILLAKAVGYNYSLYCFVADLEPFVGKAV
jgi:hypothetical protein